MKLSLTLTLATGTLCSVASFVNADDRLDMPSVRAQAPTGTYSSRVNQVVYGTPIDTPGSDWRSMGTTLRAAGDDVNFSPGPGSAGGVTVNGIAFATVAPATGTDNSCTVRFSFYDNFLGTGNNPNDTFPTSGFPGTTLLGTISYDNANFNTPGFITFYDVTIALQAGQTPVLIPDANAFVLQEIFTIATTTYHPTTYAVGRGNTSAHVSPGKSNGQRWTDNNNNLLIDAGELNAGGATNFRALYLKLQADVPPPPIPTNTPLGTLAAGDVAVPCVDLSTVPGNVAWYTFTVPADVTDAARRSLQVDTEATPGAGADVSIAIFNAGTGALATPDSVDRGSGSGTNSQLTYGIGRLLPVGDGRSYDGRSGQLVAGNYVMGIAPGGSSFVDGYVVNTGGAAAPGNACVTFRSGDASTISNPPQPVDLVAGGALGNMVAPGAPLPTFATPRRQVNWYTFTCKDMPTNGTDFLDIDFSGTLTPADGMAVVFDSCGILIAVSDDADADGVAPFYIQPQFSFGGAPASAPARAALDANAQNFAGQDGQLIGGTYYLAAGLYQLFGTIDGNGNNDRWHVRGNSGSSLNIVGQVLTNAATATVCHGCCVADYDDGSSTGVPDGGVGIEDLLWYLDLYDQGLSCADVDDGGGLGAIDGGVGIEDLLYFLGRYDAGC